MVLTICMCRVVELIPFIVSEVYLIGERLCEEQSFEG